MVKIRLQRKGRKGAPAYRIVAADSKAKRDGKFLEILGHYNPSEDPKKVEYKKDRYEYWLSVGAKPTLAVSKLISGKYKYVLYNKKTRKVEEEQKSEEANQTSEEGGNPSDGSEASSTQNNQDNQEEKKE